MKILKERKSLFVKILIGVLLVLLYVFSKEALLPKFCRDESRVLLQDQLQNNFPVSPFGALKEKLFWETCKKEQEELFWTACRELDRSQPPNAEILVSSCESPGASGVPGGELLYVNEKRTHKKYLLDLRTGEKRDIPNDPLFLEHGRFLSSELVWLEGNFRWPGSSDYRPHYLLDLTNNRRYELVDLDQFPRTEGDQFTSQYSTYFQMAEKVFLIRSESTLIALSPDFRQHPDRNVLLSFLSLGSVGSSSEDTELLEQMMKDMGVGYEVVGSSYSYYYTDINATSPTSRYYLHDSDVYISETNMPFATRKMGFYFTGWYYDDSGVIVSGRDIYFTDPFLPSYASSSTQLFVGSPILKLHPPTPEAYR